MLNEINGLCGILTIPGDKSIAHRALLFAALGTGHSRIVGLGTGADIASTARCLRQLGVSIVSDGDVWQVDSPGFGGWQTPADTLDCGNSGTTMRLLTGLLAAHPGLHATLDGDTSLRQRPMARVVEPLTVMGAQIASSQGRPPLVVTGQALHGALHVLPVASAQVKSALLLAALGVALRTHGTRHAIAGRGPQAVLPPLGEVHVPGDPSSAAFAIVLAVLHPDADVTVQRVAQNPTRTGFLRVLERMGARVTIAARAQACGEPLGNLRARSSHLCATDIAAQEVPSLIDELPILALAAAAALGTSHFSGLAELRVKESDRLAAILRLLHLLGVPAESGADWLTIHGVGAAAEFDASRAAFRPGLDHRMAMTAEVANLVSPSALEIPGFAEAVASSWPEFTAALAGLAA